MHNTCVPFSHKYCKIQGEKIFGGQCFWGQCNNTPDVFFPNIQRSDYILDLFKCNKSLVNYFIALTEWPSDITFQNKGVHHNKITHGNTFQPTIEWNLLFFFRCQWHQRNPPWPCLFVSLCFTHLLITLLAPQISWMCRKKDPKKSRLQTQGCVESLGITPLRLLDLLPCYWLPSKMPTGCAHVRLGRGLSTKILQSATRKKPCQMSDQSTLNEVYQPCVFFPIKKSLYQLLPSDLLITQMEVT